MRLNQPIRREEVIVAMSEVVSSLFQVTVSGPGGAMWKILVRAVDAESAAGAIRARGHEVVGVKAAEMPKRRTSRPRLSCIKCGYSLSNLPAGEAGEVMCPECGVINTPELPADATVFAEFKAQRRANKRPLGCIIVPLALLVIIAAIGYFVRSIGHLLGWW
jgi:hypothetical protein